MAQAGQSELIESPVIASACCPRFSRIVGGKHAGTQVWWSFVVFNVRYLIALSAFAGALTNAAFGAYAHDAQTAIVFRFLTGLFLAGVYPPGMKIMATWFQRGRGMALGVLVGALTLGKASPYLVNSVGSANWRQNIFFISLLAIAGGLIVLFFVGEDRKSTRLN